MLNVNIIRVRQDRVRELLESVWSQGCEDACDRLLASRYTISHDPGDPWEGKTLDIAGFKERLRISRAPFPDQRFQIQAIIENADGVAVTWLWSATHLGDIPGFPPSGKPIAMSGATVYSFDSLDRISGHWQVTDRLGIYRQLQENVRP